MRIKKTKFNTSFKIAADFNFFVNLLRNKKKFIYVNQIFSINEAGGLSDKRRINAIREFYIVNKYNKNMRKNNTFLLKMPKIKLFTFRLFDITLIIINFSLWKK